MGDQAVTPGPDMLFDPALQGPVVAPFATLAQHAGWFIPDAEAVEVLHQFGLVRARGQSALVTIEMQLLPPVDPGLRVIDAARFVPGLQPHRAVLETGLDLPGAELGMG